MEDTALHNHRPIELAIELDIGLEVQEMQPKRADDANNGILRNSSSSGRGNASSTLMYSVDDTPPWHLSLILAFQVYATCAY
jgi:hypothetical protein